MLIYENLVLSFEKNKHPSMRLTRLDAHGFRNHDRRGIGTHDERFFTAFRLPDCRAFERVAAQPPGERLQHGDTGGVCLSTPLLQVRQRG